ncbi:alpha/beta hydrolase family protein [Phenylobacterium sp.]|uniref:alpha/beta hydrolase family protein n=1 Tax=Phenylobacterium sp. TaxID=1871053 RepID=UPI0035661117
MRISMLLAMAAAALCLAGGAKAESPVGERHLEARNPTAALRDAEHRATVRVTVWYPAAEGSAERSLDIGPPDQPLFYVGEAAPDAAFADNRRRPVILFSHGYGGSARMMAWFTTVLAQQGFVVIAVDHPGNNSLDKMTVAGSAMFWDRAGDLQAALDKAAADPAIGPHMDLRRLGVAGYATGGFTALATAGARVDLQRFRASCAAHPDDGLCKPQLEFPVTLEQAAATLAAPELAAEVAHAGEDHSIAGVRAVFTIAPALIQAFDPASLTAMDVPVAIILGGADPVAPPNINGGAAARAIPRARLKALPGVGHYDFLSTCSPRALGAEPLCQGLRTAQGPTHFETLQMALTLFGRAMGAP